MHSAILLLISTLTAGDLKFGYPSTLTEGDRPALYVTPPRGVEVLGVECSAGAETHSWEKRNLPAKQQQTQQTTTRREWIGG